MENKKAAPTQMPPLGEKSAPTQMLALSEERTHPDTFRFSLLTVIHPVCCRRRIRTSMVQLAGRQTSLSRITTLERGGYVCQFHHSTRWVPRRLRWIMTNVVVWF